MTAPADPQTGKLNVAPLTLDEEDSVVHTRLTNDDKALRRVVKKFHNYTSVAHAPIVPIPSTSSTTVEDARDAFLIELATFHLSLKKNMMICEAEARQMEEYRREQQRIADEHHILRSQIEGLKTSLEDAQMERRRKIEYDQVAEKINAFPTREELEQSIRALENDMAAIQSEHETQNKFIQAQTSALTSIIYDLSRLRLMGKETDISEATTPAPDVVMSEATEDTDAEGRAKSRMRMQEEKEDGENDESEDERPLSAMLNPTARSFYPHSTSLISPAQRMLNKASGGQPLSNASSPTPNIGDDDIEMGELSEHSPPTMESNSKGKKKAREEELEEGEASDSSSALSDPPDD